MVDEIRFNKFGYMFKLHEQSTGPSTNRREQLRYMQVRYHCVTLSNVTQERLTRVQFFVRKLTNEIMQICNAVCELRSQTEVQPNTDVQPCR